MLHDISPTTLTPRQARGERTRRQPVTTLHPDDRVIVNLRCNPINNVHQWGGKVVAVDGVAIWLRPEWYLFGLTPNRSTGEEHVIPWSQIADINVPNGGAMLLELRCQRCGLMYTIDRRALVRGAWRYCPACRSPQPTGALADRPTLQSPRRVLEPEAAP